MFQKCKLYFFCINIFQAFTRLLKKNNYHKQRFLKLKGEIKNQIKNKEREMKKLVLPIIGGAVLLAGCLSSGPTPQAELEQNSQENIYTYTKPGIDELYKKVLNEKELEDLNACVAKEMTKRLSQEEKLFLGGNAQEKLQAKDAINSLKDKAKPTSKEMKESVGLCSVSVGIEKAIKKIIK